jgi:hypothetical protein
MSKQLNEARTELTFNCMKMEGQFSDLDLNYEANFLWLSHKALDSMIREKIVIRKIQFSMD